MAILEIHDLNVFYGDFQALFGISFALQEGETIAIIGANGAGKSTFMKALSGLLPRPAGAVLWRGRDISALPAHEIVNLGIALVPEGRKLFSSLSVEENLLIGAYARKTEGPWNLQAVYEMFPALRRHRHTPSQSLSGGQQQMVAIGRALMSNPQVLLCDEISLGLAPIIVRDIYAVIDKIKQRGTSIVLVEQDLVHAMAVSDRVYCFQEGRVSLTGRPQDLSRAAIHAAYFGV